MSVFTNEVVGPLTDAELRATPVPVSATFTPSGTQDVNIVGTTVTQPVSGTVSVSNFPATQPVSGTVAISSVGGTVAVTGPLTDTQLRAAVVPVTEAGANATVTQLVLVGNTSATALAANPNRKGVIIFNPAQPFYIKFGTTASTTSFTYKITAANTTTELANYTGRIDVMSQNAQTINITEVTA